MKKFFSYIGLGLMHVWGVIFLTLGITLIVLLVVLTTFHNKIELQKSILGTIVIKNLGLYVHRFTVHFSVGEVNYTNTFMHIVVHDFNLNFSVKKAIKNKIVFLPFSFQQLSITHIKAVVYLNENIKSNTSLNDVYSMFSFPVNNIVIPDINVTVHLGKQKVVHIYNTKLIYAKLTHIIKLSSTIEATYNGQTYYIQLNSNAPTQQDQQYTVPMVLNMYTNLMKKKKQITVQAVLFLQSKTFTPIAIHFVSQDNTLQGNVQFTDGWTNWIMKVAFQHFPYTYNVNTYHIQGNVSGHIEYILDGRFWNMQLNVQTKVSVLKNNQPFLQATNITLTATGRQSFYNENIVLNVKNDLLGTLNINYSVPILGTPTVQLQYKKLNPISFRKVYAYWPKDLVPSVRGWLSAHLTSGTAVVQFQLKILLNDTPTLQTLSGTGTLYGAKLINYYAKLPVINLRQVSARFTQKGLYFTVLKGDISAIPGISFSQSEINFNFSDNTFPMYLLIRYHGNVTPLFRVLNQSNMGLSLPTYIVALQGMVTGKTTVMVALNGNNTSKVLVNTNGKVKNVQGSLFGFDVVSNEINVIQSNKELNVTGNVRTKDSNITGQLVYSGNGSTAQINMSGVAKLEALPFVRKAKKLWVHGSVQYTYQQLIKNKQNTIQVVVKNNLNLITFQNSFFQPVPKQSIVQISAKEKSNRMWHISFASDNIVKGIKGYTIYNPDSSQILQINLAYFRWWKNDFTLLYRPDILEIKGNKIILFQKSFIQYLDRGGKSKKKKNALTKNTHIALLKNVTIDLAHIILQTADTPRYDFMMYFNYRDNTLSQLKLNNYLSKRVFIYYDQKNFNANIEDLSSIFHFFSLLKNYTGGYMTITTEQGNHYMLFLRNLHVGYTSWLINLINQLNLINLFVNEELVIKNAIVPFQIAPKNIIIRNAEMTSNNNSIGLTFSGSIDTVYWTIQGNGVFIPLNTLTDVIGKIPLLNILINRKNSLLGASYRLKGEVLDPKISVNPLTLLTPGILRKFIQF